ncbi:MAG: IS630 family transposase [Alphaproteobacteria bacterium]
MLCDAWGFLIKKSLKHPKADDGARRSFQALIALYKHQNRTLVYIDESGFAHDMPRTHGYAPIGQRCTGTQDWHAKGRTNAIGALIGKTLLTVGLFTANITADIFTAWVKQDLLSKLPPKAVIVMDNATFHKRQDTQDLIQNAGHSLLFLPPYSPDLNPIEQKWAHTKAVRKQLMCSIHDLFKIESFYVT